MIPRRRILRRVITLHGITHHVTAVTVETEVSAVTVEETAEIAGAADGAGGSWDVADAATGIVTDKVDEICRRRNMLRRKAEGIRVVTMIDARMIAGRADRQQAAVKTKLCCRVNR